jgi:hypothetical protein
MIVSSGLALSRRSERAEEYACVQHAEAVSQSFGLGIFEQLTSASLEMIERLFLDRGAPVDHEISPFAGAAAIRLLCARRYLPIEVSNVLYRTVEQPRDAEIADIRVRTIGPEES